jgi:hypothetical protein
MRRRVALLLAEIAAASQHLAVAHDHRTEGVIAKRRLFEGEAHEALVRLGRRRFDASAECRRCDRERNGAERACNHMASAHAGRTSFQAFLHCAALQQFRPTDFASLARWNVMRVPEMPAATVAPSLTVQ